VPRENSIANESRIEMTQVAMNQIETGPETLTEKRADAIGNALSWVLLGILAAMFAYAYLTQLMLR
jgi:hypothetical protein